MIKTAVILAAGLGSRLKELTKNRPKGFLEIDQQSLIERSIEKLIFFGIEKIVMGTGFLSEHFEALIHKYPLITCVKSDKYESTSSMYTLYNLKKEVNEDFLLLESDLLYDHNGLSVLLNHPEKDVILASGATNSHDEVFIETDQENFLMNMSKKREDLESISAELVGISKVSYKTFQSMCDYAAKQFKTNPKIDYEYVMCGVPEKFYVHKINQYAWIEIDDTTHLKRALGEVYPLIKERESMTQIKRNVLLNPGPATTTDSVKYAQVIPDICPREKEFGELMEYTAQEITQFVANPDKYATVLFGGSGTAAVEAMLSSIIADEEALIIVNNGSYGARMCQMADIYKLNYINFESSSQNPIDFEKLENTIKKTQNLKHLAVVHHETTTGLLNDISKLGELCKKYNLTFIVDAMSSYAAIPIDMEAMNIHFLAASSNKNIQGMAGIGFIICNQESLEQIKNIPPKNLYLNLYAQYKHFKQTKQTRFTPPVQTFYALRQAIIETKIETIPKRYERYSRCWEILINSLEKLKLKFIVPLKHHSKIITSIIEPDNDAYNFNEMHDFLYEKGYTIYPGKVSNLDTFRVSNIGTMLPEDMENFVQLLEEYLKKINYL